MRRSQFAILPLSKVNGLTGYWHLDPGEVIGFVTVPGNDEACVVLTRHSPPSGTRVELPMETVLERLTDAEAKRGK